VGCVNRDSVEAGNLAANVDPVGPGAVGGHTTGDVDAIDLTIELDVGRLPGTGAPTVTMITSASRLRSRRLARPGVHEVNSDLSEVSGVPSSE
jgi:hypothetical protein